jgi:hypothetical protein
MFKWFAGVTTKEEAKKRYRELAMKHHPDRGGRTEDMQEINNEYEKVMSGKFDEKQEATRSYMDVVSQIVKYDINIENVGSWLWVSGQKTIAIKSELKELGFKWSTSKKQWYYAEGLGKKKRSSNLAMDTIRNMYGSKIIKQEGKDKSQNLR